MSRLAVVLILAVTSTVSAQQRPYHYFYSADMPPGAIGRAQLMRGGPLPGYYQAVEFTAPQGAEIALASDGVFEPPQPGPLKAALLVGHVYRLKVANIPFREGQEVFPSVEIIHRLFPPCGSDAKFPVPIELTREELDLALQGQYVVRVIYLEDPRTALPRQEDPQHQRYFEVGPGQDPLKVADGLGRPIAILRIGSRVPDLDPESGRFLFDSPPWVRLPEIAWPQEVPVEESPGTPGPETPESVVPGTAAPAGEAVPESDGATGDRGARSPRLSVQQTATQRHSAGVGVPR